MVILLMVNSTFSLGNWIGHNEGKCWSFEKKFVDRNERVAIKAFLLRLIKSLLTFFVNTLDWSATLVWTTTLYFDEHNLNPFAGKHIGRLGHQDPGEFPEEVKALFEKAVEYYEENMVSFPTHVQGTVLKMTS